MRLLAVYIREKKGLYEDICFSFTGQYQVSYQNEELQIVERDRKYEGFYGKEIQDISVIVGKNGSGKTTLLNLIGTPFAERSGSLEEQYFLLHEVEKDRYLIERMGHFAFRNMEGAEKIEAEWFAGAFYVQREGERLRVIEKAEIVRDVRDRIVYFPAGGRYIDPAETLWIDPQMTGKWLPRVNSQMGSLDCWYTAYLDLYREKIIQSRQLALIFPVNEYRRRDWKNQDREDSVSDPAACFCMKNRAGVDYEETRSGFLHAKESFEDFLTNHINMAVQLFLIELRWIEGEDGDLFRDWLYEFRKSYSGKIPDWSEEQIRELFQALISRFQEAADRDGRIVSERKERCAFCREGLQAYRDFYCAVYRARDVILPGIDFFGIRMDGNEENDLLRNLLLYYDALEAFFRLRDMDRLYLEPVPQMSAGEEKMVSLIGNLLREIREDMGLVSLKDVCAGKTILYVIDEIEREMHLEWSRQFLNYLTQYLENCQIRIGTCGQSLQEMNIRVQLILSTHSPFLLSDLHEQSVIELEREEGGLVRQHPLEQSVFAQNIQRILMNDFFIRHGFGAFAERKLHDALEILNRLEAASQEERIFCRDLILEIGEPIVRNKLSWMYQAKFGRIPESDRSDREI